MLDEMPLYEARLLLKYLYLVDKSASERMRNLMWIIAQCNSKKRLKPEEIISFSWEREIDERPPRQLTDHEWEQQQQQARQIREKIGF